jgi:hypothetical protein
MRRGARLVGELHHAAGRLLVKAAQAGTAEAAALLHAAAARMFAEYRKWLLALRSLRREPAAAPTQVTVLGNVGQQTVTSGSQHVVHVQHADERPGDKIPKPDWGEPSPRRASMEQRVGPADPRRIEIGRRNRVQWTSNSGLAGPSNRSRQDRRSSTSGSPLA